MREVPTCFQCWPGGPVSPPPCRACGSTSDYFTSGLCARCHPHAPGDKSPARRTRTLASVVVDSCPDCHAWGVTRTYRWLCVACRSWREKHPHVGTCHSCRQQVALAENGSCRLCHKIRSLYARDLGKRPNTIGLTEANCGGQQLFFAGMWHPAGGGKQPYIKKTAPADLSLLTPVPYEQLVLLQLPRDLNAGMRHGFPPPPDSAREAAWHTFIRDYAATHGWNQGSTERTHRALRIVLGTQDTPGAAIRASDVLPMSTIRCPVQPVLDVVAAAGMLADDRLPPLERWFLNQIDQLPTDMQHELRVWFDIACHGSTTPPRCAPRAAATVKSQLAFALPAIRDWARTHHSLREIAREDIHAALPSSGTGRTTTLQGLRSIFRVLKARKLTFINPTARISEPQPPVHTPAAINLAALRAALHSADPTCAALAALLAFHAIRIWQLRQLQLTDVHDGRLHLPDHVVPLAEPVRQRLSAYLDYRHQRWPHTGNPHVFLNVRNANTTRPVTPWWVSKRLGMPAQSIRQDRILDEVHATGGDLRRLCDLFGLSIGGAYRYTVSADHPSIAQWQHRNPD